MKKLDRSTILTAVFLVAALLVIGIAGYSRDTLAQTNQNLKVFTKAELQKYDGQNGRPAYVAVNGKVYDVTNSPAWKGGKHKGNFAGTDLTAAIKNAPHGEAVLKNLTVVGLYNGK